MATVATSVHGGGANFMKILSIKEMYPSLILLIQQFIDDVLSVEVKMSSHLNLHFSFKFQRKLFLN